MIQFEKRRLEWAFAGATAGFGLWIMAPAASMDSLAFAALRSWATEYQWGLIFLITGLLHIVALAINGRRWWTPFVRLLMCFVNAMSYAAFALGFLVLDPSTTAVFNYGLERQGVALMCMYVAAQDAVFAWGARRNGIS